MEDSDARDGVVIDVPRPSLVVLVGTVGSGKSTFAARHFAEMEILSSDFFRGLVADGEYTSTATDDAFDALHLVADRRLASGRLTVIDATNVQPDTRLAWVALARRHRVPAIAIVLDVPPRVAATRAQTRADRRVDPGIIRSQRSALTSSMRLLEREGFARVYVLRGPAEADRARVLVD